MLSITTTDAPMRTPSPFNMAAHVLRHATDLADKTALSIVGGVQIENWTYRDIETAVRGVATGFTQMGLRRGDIVLLRLGNVAAFPIAYLGCIACGVIPAPLSAQLTVTEVTRIAAQINPAAAIQDDVMDHGVDQIIDLGRLQSFFSLPPVPYDMGDPDRPAYIIHTSGTSGQSRAVVHAHRAVWARQMMWDGWYGLTNTDRVLHAGAFNWTYTLGTGLMDPWAIGATALIPADGTDASALPALMADHKATFFAAAPGVYRRLLRAEIPAMPALRHGLSAGEKLPHDTRRAWEKKTQTQIHEAFGMSECSTFISGNPNRPAPHDTLGFPQSGRRIAILANGKPVPLGQAGQIAIHRDDCGLMIGYWGAPVQEDWYLTGDIGVMDTDGAITYLGRNDDMMNAGGYRVSPIEVEAALASHPSISDVGACEVTVKSGVSVIAAFYTSTDVLDTEQLTAWCADRLAGYKCPRIFIARDSLPRGANNKLLRRVLRQNWETANGQT